MFPPTLQERETYSWHFPNSPEYGTLRSLELHFENIGSLLSLKVDCEWDPQRNKTEDEILENVRMSHPRALGNADRALDSSAF